MKLDLTRPLVALDCETTGSDPKTARIVELSMVRIDTDGLMETVTARCNPEIPIPADASAIHGIHDEDVVGEPVFKQRARAIVDYIGDADLLGFNVWRFDLPVLRRQLLESGHLLPMDGRRVIDAMRIYHLHEPRDLASAVKFYCGDVHDQAHSAEADARATIRVLAKQIERYDLGSDIDKLHDLCADERGAPLDVNGVLRLTKDGRTVFAIGKYQGKELAEVVQRDRSYLDWFCNKGDFAPDAKQMVRQALVGGSA